MEELVLNNRGVWFFFFFFNMLALEHHTHIQMRDKVSTQFTPYLHAHAYIVSPGKTGIKG